MLGVGAGLVRLVRLAGRIRGVWRGWRNLKLYLLLFWTLWWLRELDSGAELEMGNSNEVIMGSKGFGCEVHLNIAIY